MKKSYQFFIFLFSAVFLQQVATAGSSRPAESLEAELVVVKNQKAFLDKWNSKEASPKIENVSEIEKGESIYVYLVFKNCASTSPKSECKVVSELSLKSLDKSSTMLGRIVVWNDLTPPQGLYFLGKEHIEIGFSEEDDSGSYEIIAKVIDVNARKAKVLTKTVILL